MQQIISMIPKEGWWIVVIVVLSAIQISPLKINPWAWIGNALNKDILEKIENLENRIDVVEQGIALANEKCDRYEARRDEDKTIQTRIRILKFNDELLREQLHSEESFNQCLEDITHYNNYCDLHKGFCNEKADMAIENIRRAYQECCEKHNFI